MQFKEVCGELEKAGTVQNRKIYEKHGVHEKMYGVSYAVLRGLKKKIKTDHLLALQLWQTDIHDARVLACMIADPRQVDDKLIDTWSCQAKNYLLADELANLLWQTQSARTRVFLWIRSNDEWIGRLGYKIAALLALKSEKIPEAFFINILNCIEKEIHQQPNRKREAMNSALIAIGLRNRHLQFLAEQAAGRIGTVHIDHGDTHCKTPDAIPYIEKAWERKMQSVK